MRSATHFASAALALAALAFGGVPPAGAADTPNPPVEAKAFRDFFTQKFPKLKLEDFVNGPYSMSEDMHRQWEEKEQFPPYEFSVDMGKEMFSKPFKNGKSYADCFPNQGIGIRQNYPYFDDKEGKVVTLELALNRCREANGEAPFSYVKDEMAALTAYMAFTSRGKPFDIKIPDDPRALEAYQNGKRYFYTRRGQLRTRARDPECAADLSFRLERHGHDQPALHHLQQPDSRRATQSAGRRIPRSRILFVLCQQRTADFRSGSAAMSMIRASTLSLALALLMAGATLVLAAGSEADFKAAYAAAEAANKEAGALRNQWTVTAAALADAKKAADKGDFDQAIVSSKEAEALAKASIYQATSEKTLWKELEIR